MPLGAALTWGQLADQGQCRELPQCLVAYVDFPRIKKKKKKLVLTFIMLYFFNTSRLSFSCNSFF